MAKTKPKAKGTRFETATVNFINDWAGSKVCERVTLYGHKDHGDVRLKVDDLVICVEDKWREKYPSTSDMADFREQTLKEMTNSGSDGCVLVVNRYRMGIERAEAWVPFSTLMRLLALDEHADQYNGEHDWCCLTLLEFCWLCFGAPAWGWKG